MFEPTTVLVTAMICVPAMLLAAQRSTWLVDYLFFVIALNRGIRRIVDYENGYFNQYSLISLTPMIVGGLATLVVLIELNSRFGWLGEYSKKTLNYYGIAIAISFVIGFINTKFASVYALGDYIAPIGLLGFAAMHADDTKVIDRWCHSVALSAVVVAVYGIWQFYTIPPWDAFWVTAVNFEGYLGTLEPTKMTLFSTMAERGPAAAYLCGGLVLLVLKGGTLSWLRWPAVAVVLYAMLLTYSRTTVIQASLACILYPLINRGSGMFPVIGIAVVVAFLGQPLLNLLPGTELAASRVGTIGSIQNDGSFQGRTAVVGYALQASLSEPLGLGIGAHGLASRVGEATRAGHGDTSGYIETLRTFGWMGFVLVSVVLYRLWRSSSELIRIQWDDANVLLFRAWFVSGMIALFSGNWLFAASFFWVLAGHSIGRLDIADVCASEENEYCQPSGAIDNWELDNPLGTNDDPGFSPQMNCT